MPDPIRNISQQRAKRKLDAFLEPDVTDHPSRYKAADDLARHYSNLSEVDKERFHDEARKHPRLGEIFDSSAILEGARIAHDIRGLGVGVTDRFRDDPASRVVRKALTGLERDVAPRTAGRLRPEDKNRMCEAIALTSDFHTEAERQRLQALLERSSETEAMIQSHMEELSTIGGSPPSSPPPFVANHHRPPTPVRSGSSLPSSPPQFHVQRLEHGNERLQDRHWAETTPPASPASPGFVIHEDPSSSLPTSPRQFEADQRVQHPPESSLSSESSSNGNEENLDPRHFSERSRDRGDAR